MSDDRGAVMVVSVFLAAFLVGALWYLAGVGNAALFKERMQDGADAAAFAAAVYHARGMNIIAEVNLIMAAILGVLIALKIASMLLMITNIISTAICYLPYGVGAWACPIMVASEVGKEDVDGIIQTVEPIVNDTLMVLSKLQVGIAIAIPWMAEDKANTVAKMYQKPVDGGLHISESLMPSDPRLGLPVQEDKYSVLCDKAANFVGQWALEPFSAFGVPTTWAGGLVQGLVDMAPSYFCGEDDSGGGSSGSGGSGGSGGSSNSNNASAAKTSCDAQQKQVDDYNKDHKKHTIDFDYDKCIDDTTKKLNQSGGMGSGSGGGSSSSSSSGKTPKRVFDDAKNGNKYFGVTSWVWGDLKLTKMADRRVKVAAWGQTVIAPPDIWGKAHFAQAEFYYDQTGDWDSYKADAMWNLRWRARLRRYHKENAADSGYLMDIVSVAGVALDAVQAIQSVSTTGLAGLTNDVSGNVNFQDGHKHLADLYAKEANKTTGDGDYKTIDVISEIECVH